MLVSLQKTKGKLFICENRKSLENCEQCEQEWKNLLQQTVPFNSVEHLALCFRLPQLKCSMKTKKVLNASGFSHVNSWRNMKNCLNCFSVLEHESLQEKLINFTGDYVTRIHVISNDNNRPLSMTRLSSDKRPNKLHRIMQFSIH